MSDRRPHEPDVLPSTRLPPPVRLPVRPRQAILASIDANKDLSSDSEAVAKALELLDKLCDHSRLLAKVSCHVVSFFRVMSRSATEVVV